MIYLHFICICCCKKNKIKLPNSEIPPSNPLIALTPLISFQVVSKQLTLTDLMFQLE